MATGTYQGLTSAAVAERIRRGLVNRTPQSAWADYRRIVTRNLFTLFNALVAPAAIALFALGKLQGALAVSGMAIVNTALGLAQEIHAKRQLDRLAILTETKARVLRDGQAVEIAAADVVQDDLVLLSSGAAVVADGSVVEAHFLEVDEALLTGESDPVRRQPGERLLSGGFCVAGEGSYRAERVGSEAFALSTADQARSYRFAPSPLTRTINVLIQVLTYTAVALCLIYVGLLLAGRTTDEEMVSDMAATITSMVPQGLVLTATIAFSLGAVRMSLQGAVVQRLSAVESMASVDVICTDKTGTLTTNRLRLDHVRAVGKVDEAEGRRRLALFAAGSMDHASKAVQALRAALGTPAVTALDQLPFKSQNRYSAVRLRDGGDERLLVMGACEALQPLLGPGSGSWERLWHELLPTGLRLLLFAEATEPRPLGAALAGLELRPLLLVAFSDELRPEAAAVLENLAGQGIAFKVISGDNPETVRATIGTLDLPLAREPVVSGAELQAASDPAAVVDAHSVFGRVAPAQKVQIVEALQRRGRHVAMIGDGVNDVLPIKRSDLGIAMGEGSQAAKTVSSLVLENNNFALLPETLEEGRTIVRNIRRSAKLFLVKNVYSLVLILAYTSGWFGVPFPYEPQQVTLLNWLVIGLPALAIALSRERAPAATKPRFLLEVGWFAIRSGVVFAIAALALLLVAVHGLEADVKTQRTLLLSLLVLLGITALLRALGDGEPEGLRGDNRFRWLAAAAVPTYLAAMYLPPASAFFQLTPLGPGQWALVLGIGAVGYAVSLATDCWRPG